MAYGHTNTVTIIGIYYMPMAVTVLLQLPLFWVLGSQTISMKMLAPQRTSTAFQSPPSDIVALYARETLPLYFIAYRLQIQIAYSVVQSYASFSTEAISPQDVLFSEELL